MVRFCVISYGSPSRDVGEVQHGHYTVYTYIYIYIHINISLPLNTYICIYVYWKGQV